MTVEILIGGFYVAHHADWSWFIKRLEPVCAGMMIPCAEGGTKPWADGIYARIAEDSHD